MKPIRASTVAASLESIGVSLDQVPPLHELVETMKQDVDSTRLRALMRSFTQSLGVTCSGCHTVQKPDGHIDFEAETPERKVTGQMWDQFVRKLASKDGFPVYCDSCHQGALKVLDRQDRTSLAADMQTAFVDALEPRDGTPMACATCHGTPMNMRFIGQWKE